MSRIFQEPPKNQKKKKVNKKSLNNSGGYQRIVSISFEISKRSPLKKKNTWIGSKPQRTAQNPSKYRQESQRIDCERQNCGASVNNRTKMCGIAGKRNVTDPPEQQTRPLFQHSPIHLISNNNRNNSNGKKNEWHLSICYFFISFILSLVLVFFIHSSMVLFS